MRKTVKERVLVRVRRKGNSETSNDVIVARTYSIELTLNKSIV